MNKKAHILTLIAAASAMLPAAAAITGQWRLHPTFDNSFLKVIDTPTRAYFIGYPYQYNPTIQDLAQPDYMLFYYDKEGDEMVAAAQRHPLSTTTVRSIDYNPDKQYLLIVYDNQDIDLLHDDGSVSNIGALKNATLVGSKDVNSVSFDPAHDLAWLATEFGYIAINDERLEVAESRNYSTPLTSVTRVGDTVYLSDGQQLMKAPFKSNRMQITDYSPADEFQASAKFYQMSPTRVLVWEPHEDNSSFVGIYDINNGNLEEVNSATPNTVYQILPAKDGYTITTYSAVGIIRSDTGKIEYFARPDDEKVRRYGATWDMKELYTGAPRKGMRSFTLGSDRKFVLSRDYMLPNAPNAYISRNLAYHPKYGMLVSTYGTDYLRPSTVFRYPNLIAGLKDGEWTPYSYEYLNPEQNGTGQTPKGITIDPADDRYIYVGSSFSGLTRMNLEDPQDVIHWTHPKDPTASNPGFVEMFETGAKWANLSSVADPVFDADNTLWAYSYDHDDKNRIVFRYLTDEDRRATKDAASARPWKTLVKNVSNFGGINAKFLPLKASVNRNFIIYMGPSGLFVLDHNGTPDNPADDKITVLNQLTDQDGNILRIAPPNQIWEDPQTGVVWIASTTGIFYCTPRNLLQGQAVLNRVKVSRNDGTSLADYLLNGEEIAGIAHDSDGRMWIGTLNAGIVVTSADGKTVYQEFTEDNSDLPSNSIYDILFNPGTGSMMISTGKGLCEFFIGGSTNSASDTDAVRAYPNPVTPDYYGWVTIDGLPDNALVKIVDVKGNLVRELGRAQGGSVQWDANNLHFNRVKTGVYYILASPGSSEGGESRVGKIMVIN